MAMKWKAVTSSAISQIGYDPVTTALGVRFKSGSTYEYHNVEPETYDAFARAASKGKFFQSEIRDRYDYDQV